MRDHDKWEIWIDGLVVPVWFYGTSFDVDFDNVIVDAFEDFEEVSDGRTPKEYIEAEMTERVWDAVIDYHIDVERDRIERDEYDADRAYDEWRDRQIDEDYYL